MSVLGILGTVHSERLRSDYNYPLEKMGRLIRQFNPDIICGEIRPEDWENYLKNKEYKGYLGPNEYRKLIIPLCEKDNIKFMPVDWFEDDMKEMNFLKGKSEIEINYIENQYEAIMNSYMAAAGNSVIPFNSLDFNGIVQKKHEFQSSINPEAHNLYWSCRNQLMVYRIKMALEANRGKKVLCTVGAEHAYYLCQSLQNTGWSIIYPLN